MLCSGAIAAESSGLGRCFMQRLSQPKNLDYLENLPGANQLSGIVMLTLYRQTLQKFAASDYSNHLKRFAMSLDIIYNGNIIPYCLNMLHIRYLCQHNKSFPYAYRHRHTAKVRVC
jgi:hypothetical protein